MNRKRPVAFHFPREHLLIEIDRRCAVDDCTARNHIGLTNSEAIEYRGFDCTQCKQWNDDQLKQSEIPEAWLDQVKDTQS